MYSEPGQWSEMECFANITIVFNYFCKKKKKKFSLKSLRGFWICVGFCIYQSSEYYSIFVYLTSFWICVGIQLWKGPRIFQDPEYASFLCMQMLYKVLNMPECRWIMPYGRILNMSSQSFKPQVSRVLSLQF